MRRSLGCLLLAGSLSLTAADWPRYRGADTSGISTEKDWLGAWPGGQPKRLWKATVGIGFASMTVADGRLYTLGNAQDTDTIYCFDAATGAEQWKHSYKEKLHDHYYEGGPGSTPTVDGDRVYVFSKAGLVLCLEAKTGNVVWTKQVVTDFGCEKPEWGFNGSPHLEGDLVVLNAGNAGLALKKADGSLAWQTGKAAAGYGTAVPFQNQGRRALALFAAKHVVALEPDTGKELWRFPWETSYDVNAADPVVLGNLMFLSSGYNKGGAAIDFSGGQPKQVWFNKELRNHMASSVVIGEHLYGVDGQGGDKDSKLKCVEFKTGKVVWTSPKAATGALAAADGKLIWLTGNGEVVVVEASPAGYREITRAQVNGGKHWTAPVLANGRLYVRNAKGELVCLDVKGAGPVS
jgi:outer membrane protein assembly factor BamB